MSTWAGNCLGRRWRSSAAQPGRSPRRFGVLKATAHTKLLNCATNIGAFVVFALAGAVFWKIALLMGAAQFLGARLGAGLAIRNGAKIIKPLLVVVCVALAVKLLADPPNPLRVAIGF